MAVLAAVSEEIKCRGGTESNTEYFAALVSDFKVLKGDINKITTHQGLFSETP